MHPAPFFIKFTIKSICQIEEKTEADTFHKSLDETIHAGLKVTTAAPGRPLVSFGFSNSKKKVLGGSLPCQERATYQRCCVQTYGAAVKAHTLLT